MTGLHNNFISASENARSCRVGWKAVRGMRLEICEMRPCRSAGLQEFWEEVGELWNEG